MIVKIQQPLNDPAGPLLVYDKDRRFQLITNRTPHLMETLGDKPKVYVKVAFEGDELVVLKVLKEQPW
jgi:hypothetical protein